MKKVFRKYQFGSKGAATTKINALGTETTPKEMLYLITLTLSYILDTW